MDNYFPISINLENKKCVLVGGGNIAMHKLEVLVKYDIHLEIITKEIKDSRIEEIVNKYDNINLKIKEIEESDLDDAFMIIVATDDINLNKELYLKYNSKNRLINVVDKVENSNFIFGSIVKRGDLNIMISTSGSSPYFSKKVRKYIENKFGEEYKDILNLLKEYRIKAYENIQNKDKRLEFLKKCVEIIDIDNKLDINEFRQYLEIEFKKSEL